MKKTEVPEGMLRISWYTASTECLGPGKRFALWVQGCERRCKGCIAEPLQPLDGGQLVRLDTLAREISESGAEGLTISGGEPFLQAEGLAELIRLVRRERPETGVIIFTGFLHEELMKDEGSRRLLDETDLLIDGEYTEELNDGGAMRGSSNQRMLYLTDRYAPSQMPFHRTNRVIFSDGSLRMIGIPSKGARLLLDILKK